MDDAVEHLNTLARNPVNDQVPMRTTKDCSTSSRILLSDAILFLLKRQ
jgi:hypothetical protein